MAVGKGKNKLLRALYIVLAVFIITGSFTLGYFTNAWSNGKDAEYVGELVRYLKNYGVIDTETLEVKNLDYEDISKMIASSLSASDNYCSYYTQEEYEKVVNNGSGNYTGIGISVLGDDLSVFKVTLNSPAHKAGVECGDNLLGAIRGGKETLFSSYKDVTNFIAQVPLGSEFILNALRNGENVSFKIKREKYVASYVTYMDSEKEVYFLSDDGKTPEKTVSDGGIPALPQDTAYISLSKFEGESYGEICTALDFMKERGRSKLIFDLRDNGGGYMSVLTGIATRLCDAKTGKAFTVAMAKDAKGATTEYKSHGNRFGDFISKISVIANERSASASECLMGAMLYYGNAVQKEYVVIENDVLSGGTARTFGKGIMQTTFPLSDGGAIKLTTAVIYQPDGATCIHNKGITATGENAVTKSENIALSRAIDLLKD